jgi:putative Holliday junction resolvase
MNILGIDYGEKRIGLAWVQDGLDVVLPFGQLAHDGTVYDALTTLTKEEGIDVIVVGLPLGMDGGENENTARVRAFATTLSVETGLPVELSDERFSSRQADAMGGDVSRDEKSAMVILQSYMEKKK